jgi:hypothetical protein
MTGAVVGIPIFFTDETFVLDFTSIGTLFAFVLVCGGVLLLPKAEKVEGVKQRFRLPHINGKWIVPAIVVAAFALLLNDNSTYTEELFQFNSTNLSAKLPMWIFLLLCLIMATMSFLRNLSLIPVLGVLSCCYLLTGMAPSNWLWFGVWLLIGLVVYLLYGFRKSKLAQHT